jgi:hypothetical protein
MALPLDWVDAIFARLRLAYGERFVAQYGPLDPEQVKADWANTLDGITSGGVRHAYDHLPPDYPPNALQFRALCRGLRTPDRPALAAPGGKATPADIARLNRAASVLRAPRDPRAWIGLLLARQAAGERLSRCQLEMLRASCAGTTVHRASDDEQGTEPVSGAVSGPEK